jgi:hypothetical protein
MLTLRPNILNHVIDVQSAYTVQLVAEVKMI